MTHNTLNIYYEIDWKAVIDDCDQTGDGKIDFQEFIAACISRKAITNRDEINVAFQILDSNRDGQISIEDLNDLFCSYGGKKVNMEMWEELLLEADRNGDGMVSENEFAAAMSNIIRRSLRTP